MEWNNTRWRDVSWVQRLVLSTKDGPLERLGFTTKNIRVPHKRQQYLKTESQVKIIAKNSPIHRITILGAQIWTKYLITKRAEII